MLDPLFGSLFLAGFECATHKRYDGRRLDLTATTRHFEFCESDYALARRHGMKAARDGFRWHIVGREIGKRDWSTAIPMLEAAKRQNMTVIWDLCHYGYPEWLNIWSDAFPDQLALYSAEAVRLIREITGQRPMICPVNEVSFWSWLGGDGGKIDPYGIDKGPVLKKQLVAAKLASIAAARAADPETVVISAEPLINIVQKTNAEDDLAAAAGYHEAQFEATDMMLGRMAPELGGDANAIDVIGVNYYPHNQWHLNASFVPLGHHSYRPLSELLMQVWRRYRKPLFIAETGAEYSARPAWMHYICEEVREALRQGVPVHGICIYPIAAHEGWDNERVCEVGLFSEADDRGERHVYRPLFDEMNRQAGLFRDMDVPRFNRAAE